MKVKCHNCPTVLPREDMFYVDTNIFVCSECLEVIDAERAADKIRVMQATIDRQAAELSAARAINDERASVIEEFEQYNLYAAQVYEAEQRKVQQQAAELSTAHEMNDIRSAIIERLTGELNDLRMRNEELTDALKCMYDTFSTMGSALPPGQRFGEGANRKAREVLERAK